MSSVLRLLLVWATEDNLVAPVSCDRPGIVVLSQHHV